MYNQDNSPEKAKHVDKLWNERMKRRAVKGFLESGNPDDPAHAKLKDWVENGGLDTMRSYRDRGELHRYRTETEPKGDE